MDDQLQHLDLADSVEISNDNSKGEPRVTVKIRTNEKRNAQEAATLALLLYENTLEELRRNHTPTAA